MRKRGRPPWTGFLESSVLFRVELAVGNQARSPREIYDCFGLERVVTFSTFRHWVEERRRESVRNQPTPEQLGCLRSRHGTRGLRSVRVNAYEGLPLAELALVAGSAMLDYAGILRAVTDNLIDLGRALLNAAADRTPAGNGPTAAQERFAAGGVRVDSAQTAGGAYGRSSAGTAESE